MSLVTSLSYSLATIPHGMQGTLILLHVRTKKAMAMCSRAWILGEQHFHKVYLDCHIQGQGLLTDMISLAGLKGTHYPQTVWSNFCSFQTALFIWCLAWITMIVSKRRSSLSKKKKKKTKCELLKLIDGDRLAEPWLLKLMTSLRKGDFEWRHVSNEW